MISNPRRLYPTIRRRGIEVLPCSDNHNNVQNLLKNHWEKSIVRLTPTRHEASRIFELLVIPMDKTHCQKIQYYGMYLVHCQFAFLRPGGMVQCSCPRRRSSTIIQVKNMGNVRLEHATMWDDMATLSCDGIPAMLEPAQSFVCSGSSVLSWATIEAGIIKTTSRWAHILQVVQLPS